MPDRKSVFTVNLPLKLFRPTVTNIDTGSQKFIHTLFDTYTLDHILVKFEPKRMVQNVQNFEIFDGFLKPFWRHFARRFCN